MNEGHEDASDNIRFRIWSGYYDQDEVFDIVTDEADGEDEEGLAEYTNQAGNVQRKLFKNVQENKALGRAGLHAEVRHG